MSELSVCLQVEFLVYMVTKYEPMHFDLSIL